MVKATVLQGCFTQSNSEQFIGDVKSESRLQNPSHQIIASSLKVSLKSQNTTTSAESHMLNVTRKLPMDTMTSQFFCFALVQLRI